MYILYQALGCAERLRGKGLHSRIAYRNCEKGESRIYIRKEFHMMRGLRSRHRKIVLRIQIM